MAAAQHVMEAIGKTILIYLPDTVDPRGPKGK